MPYYLDLNNLPKAVRNHLPLHARAIYLNAFNLAWDEYRDPDNLWSASTREGTASAIAWAAVLKVYEENVLTGEWKRKAPRIRVHA